MVRRRTAELRASLAVSRQALVGIGGGALPATPTPPLPPGIERPNVLLITVDDLASVDMPYLPRVRRLLEKGGVAGPSKTASGKNASFGFGGGKGGKKK